MSNGNSVYSTFQGLSAKFPIPKPSATVKVGTWNAATNLFTYAVPSYHKTIGEESGGLKPHPIMHTGREVTVINVYNLYLSFEVVNGQGNLQVSIPGLPTVTAPSSNPNSVAINVGTLECVNSLTLKSGGRTFDLIRDLPLLIYRPLVGVGAFTLPALPIAIVYAPPQGSLNKNTQTFSWSKSSGTTSQVSLSQQRVTAPQLALVRAGAEFQTDLKVASQVIGLLPAPAAEFAKLLNLAAAGYSPPADTKTVDVTVSNQHTLTVQDTTGNAVTTDPATGGPGSGDILCFLRNVRLVWFVDNGQLKLALIDFEGISLLTVHALQTQGVQTGLDPATIQALCNLDPLIAGPKAVLSPPRFTRPEPQNVQVGGGTSPYKYTVTHTVTQSDLETTTTVNQDVASAGQSLPNYLGPDATDDTVQVKLTQSSASGTTTGNTVSTELDLYSGPLEIYCVDLFYDTIFGTFAMQQSAVTAASSPLLSGVAFDASNRPAALQEVRLASGNQVFATRTDDKGRYAFHAAAIKPGPVTLNSGARHKEIRIESGKTQNVDLR